MELADVVEACLEAYAMNSFSSSFGDVEGGAELGPLLFSLRLRFKSGLARGTRSAALFFAVLSATNDIDEFAHEVFVSGGDSIHMFSASESCVSS